MATRAVFSPLSAEYHNTSNFPALVAVNNRPALAFDAGTDEECCWTTKAPQGLTGTTSLYVDYVMASATTGAVRFQASVEAITDGDAVDLDATTSFDTANSAGETVPGTAGHMSTLQVTLTNQDSVTAADYVRISLRRDADQTSGTDDATGDCYVLQAEWRDTA